MKIAAVKKFTQVLVAMAVAAVMAALLCAPKALGTTIGEFSIEQIYVNVPELDVFVQATDAQGQPISPDLVRAAGVEMYLGDEKIPTGNIGMANEPICYVLAVDNSVDETTLKEYRIALRRLISAKGAKDQIMLYTLAGDYEDAKTKAGKSWFDALEPWDGGCPVEMYTGAVKRFTFVKDQQINLITSVGQLFGKQPDSDGGSAILKKGLGREHKDLQRLVR